MGNHVIRDRLWESNKLAACSRDAALAYPWIFLVADDYGRFEYNPRRIWTKVFGQRRDVSLRHVTAWLEEYRRRGLLVRYHIDGDLAAWTGFLGRPPTQRRPSDYPDPKDFTAFCPTGEVAVAYPLAEQSRADKEQSRAETGAPRRRGRVSSGADTPDTAENRAPIDAYNAAFETKLTYTPGNLSASARALSAGYTLDQMQVVFSAVQERKTLTAAWCKDNNREFEYLIRPAYKHNRTQEITQGPLDKIPNELATGRRAS